MEFRREYEREFIEKGLTEHGAIRDPYTRHCWIRPDSSDPTGLVTAFLTRCGVGSLKLGSWKPNEVRNVLDELLRYDYIGQ
jgi:hypothetical protein